MHKYADENVPDSSQEIDQRFLDALKQGDYLNAAYAFRDRLIGDPGFPVDIHILQDDGQTLLFCSDRGVFKVSGPTRLMALSARADEIVWFQKLIPLRQFVVG